MKKTAFLFALAVLSIFIIVACSNEETKKEEVIDEDKSIEAVADKANDIKDEENPVSQTLLPIPQSFKESVDYGYTGEWAMKEFSNEVKSALDQLPSITMEATEEEIDAYEREIFSLFKENLSMPNVPIDQWQAMKFADPTVTEEESQLKKNYNVAILLDASGSMGALENGKTRMELAKEAINQFVDSLPEKAKVSLTVYGHKGTGDEADKEVSCSTVEQVYSLSAYDSKEFTNALGKFNPAGWTPMTKAVEQAMVNLESHDGSENTNIIYLVSDGIETCGGNPVQAMEKLSDSNLSPVVQIIGYQVNNDGLTQLKEMARAANGQFINVQNQEDLKAEFKRTTEMAEVWSEWHRNSNDAINNLNKTVQKQLNDWHHKEQEKMNRERKNLQLAINYLNEENKIDTDVFLRLDENYRAYYLQVDKEARNLYLELDQLNRESFLDNWEEISEIFLKNVSE
ncbi:VWA domain-containing protein [Cytobacillus kochii]|uniref:vWA domain-containing protein n=1 Tax=Cytobacillus kochii TaxID=859143 RepID=UPI001CD424B3|nr:VWA domain-containing protein [Cytobacillus kochii]MCA1027135.1 VWA domain-containing protein [Cytobacillus kochii]